MMEIQSIHLTKRCILILLTVEIEKINKMITEQFPGHQRIYDNTDYTVNENQLILYN